MLFNSFVFLLYFLPITYLVFWSLREVNHRYIWLTITGYVFYGAWNWKFCFLMLFSTLVSYLAGILMNRWDENERFRRLCLVIPVATDLALLCYFKYANFFLKSASVVASWAGTTWSAHPLDIVLPIGISFYTFHTISYIVDGYRRTIRPTRNFWEFACYVSLFSQLVAGPIVRFKQIEADLEHIGEARRDQWAPRGWSFFILGMAQKVLLADSIAAIINPALLNYEGLSSLGAWACMLGYTYQLYFDFSGYSNMAVGLGLLFGLRIPQNFNSPYRATSMSDFWRRWHISLSSCLRDYLFIPLGGSRGTGWLTYRNLMLTMLIGGLWHGANWTFVAWGAYHGAMLSVNRWQEEWWNRKPVLLQRIATFLAVVMGWVLFRATNFEMATSLFARMLHPTAGLFPDRAATLTVLLALSVVLAHFGRNIFELSHEWNPIETIALAALFVVCLLRIYGASSSPFLYFQF